MTTQPRDRLRQISLALAILGLFVAGYLSYTHATGTEIACVEGVSNCEVVNASYYASFPPSEGGKGGIYVGYLGFAGYLTILATLILERRVPFLQRWGGLILVGMTFFGFLFSMYLTAIEAFVLYEWCQWCVVSAITMTILFGVSLARLWQGAPEDALEDGEA